MLPNTIKTYVQTELHANSGGISDIAELGEGRSEALVYRVKVISNQSNLSGIYIIKLINTSSKWFSRQDNEEQKCKNLHSQAGTFSNHLVDLVDSKEIDGYVVLLYRQANDSILNSDMLDRLDGTGKAEYLKVVSYELLSKMNANFRQDSSAKDFFQVVLKYRLNADGNFYRVANEVLEKPTAPAVLIGTKVYPNPIYYIQMQEEWLPFCKSMVLMRGNMHGDLHGENIICTKDMTEPENLQYSIIDYDSCDVDGFLFFDQAYLELYLYSRLFPENDLNKWHDTLSPLMRESFRSAVTVRFGDYSAYFRNAICEGINRWGEETVPHLKDDLDIQFFLSRIAAGANFFSKRGITDQGSRVKYLMYMGICFETLFRKISFPWSPEQPSALKSGYVASNLNCMDKLWKNCLSYAPSYTPVLLTDDNCHVQDGHQLAGLSLIDWRLVIDVGTNSAPDDISTWVPERLAQRRHISTHSTVGSGSFHASNSGCEWVICKKESAAYQHLWLTHQRNIKKLWQSIRGTNRMKPYLFVFDTKEGLSFAKGFFNSLLDNIQQMEGSRFVSLQSLFDEETKEALREFHCTCDNFEDVSLLDLATTAQNYFAANNDSESYITLPHLDSMPDCHLTEKELAYYKTSVQLVYSGLENDDSDCDFGASFYRGYEIKWRDIANQCDLELDTRYGSWIQALKHDLIEGTSRIRRLKLIHGAGTGGTTLSKRILWDMKETTPAMRLLHYTQDTANILLEIYRKTGKPLLLSVEMGSTVINEDELGNLISAVNSENGKLWVLQVERSHGTVKEDQEKPFIELPDTLSNPIARNFFDKFRQMTTDRRRQDALNHITNLTGDVWIAQRSPFFYGFYTFQEEYNLENIQRTVTTCSTEVQTLLSDMALMTIYSQNIGVPVSEAAIRLSGDDVVPNILALVLKKMGAAVSKIVVHRESGLRICHTLIAGKILEELYGDKKQNNHVSAAALSLIDRLYQYYGEEDESVDVVLRELFIDRAVVDNERMKFSVLISDIEENTKREEIFQKLIDYYPSNPHYLNHMARLLVSKETADYENAIKLIDMAIDISDDESVKIHYITKGCILSRKVFSRMDGIRASTRRGGYAMKFPQIIDEIQNDYTAAEGAFISARESGLTSDSYTYFPYISLECRFLEKLANCDKDRRSRQQLLQEDKDFQACYQEHYGKAVELYDQMRTYCWDSAEDILKRACGLLDALTLNESKLVEKLDRCTGMTGRQAQFARRTYAAAIYANANYSWQNLDLHSLEKIEQAMYVNLRQGTRGIALQDIDFWFEAYCRLKTFSAERAIDIIQDYMPDGYTKEFRLSILQFLRLEKGFATVQNVIQHSAACKRMTPSNINTSKAHMAYAEDITGCPIIPMRYVRRGKYGEYIGLKQFQGTITDIRGSTSAIIRVDRLGLDAVFVPSIRTEDGQKREFTSQNRYDRVKFNLLFSYSGLRAWNIE